jgi:hypothetical protein
VFREPEQHRLEVSVIMTSQLMMRCPCGNDSATRCKTQDRTHAHTRDRISRAALSQAAGDKTHEPGGDGSRACRRCALASRTALCKARSSRRSSTTQHGEHKIGMNWLTNVWVHMRPRCARAPQIRLSTQQHRRMSAKVKPHGKQPHRRSGKRSRSDLAEGYDGPCGHGHRDLV